MKVHITLVGGQPAPVYNGIMATQPEKIVFVYSDKSRETAERISKEVNLPSERRKMDPVDLNDIEKKVIRCAQDFKDDEVSVNISSGTKPWAFYFAKIFGTMPNATLFYVDQNNTLWNLSDKSLRKVEFDMDAQFRLLGYPLENYIDIQNITKEDKQVLVDIQELVNFSHDNFFRLVSETNAKPYLTKHILPNCSFLEWNKNQKQFVISVSKGNSKLNKTLKSKNARTFLLKAGWFEHKVASMLEKWDKAKTIRMNCTFPYRDSATKNEIDVIVATESKLLFVECKTQIEDNTDIDKFSAAVRNYGGMGSKALFVTEAAMTAKAQEKCADNGILTFSLQNDNVRLEPEKALALLLDSELFNINTK